jgi:hypothetical protein
MRKLLKAILNAPTFTADELYTIFTAKKLMAAKNTFAHALLANDEITGRRVSTAFIETAAIFEDVQKFNDDLHTAWDTVQLQKPKKKDRHDFAADDAVPIAAEMVPDDISIEDLKKIKDYLEALHYTLQTLVREANEDSTYSAFDYSIAQIELAVTAKLPPELQGPVYVDEDAELQEPLVPAAPILSADVIATIAILKNKDEEEKRALNEEQIIRKSKQQKAKISELSRAYHQKRELSLTYRFDKEFKQYKSVLASYIKDKLETKDYNIYTSCFNQPTYGTAAKVDPIAKIAEVINKNDDQITDAHDLSIKKFAKENLNFSRAVANYKLIHDAQTQLRPRNPSENEPEHLVQRLKGLYQDHANIDLSLQTVGDEAVDKATSGIRGFFKKIFSSINWYFSAAGKKDREFKAFAKNNREHFFKVMQDQPVVVVEPVVPNTPTASPAA